MTAMSENTTGNVLNSKAIKFTAKNAFPEFKLPKLFTQELAQRFKREISTNPTRSRECA